VEPKAGRDWRSILLAIASTGGAILAVALAVIVVVVQAAMTLRGDQQKHPLIDAVLLASAILFVGALLIPGAYYSIQRLIGEEVDRIVVAHLTASSTTGFIRMARRQAVAPPNFEIENMLSTCLARR